MIGSGAGVALSDSSSGPPSTRPAWRSINATVGVGGSPAWKKRWIEARVARAATTRAVISRGNTRVKIPRNIALKLGYLVHRRNPFAPLCPQALFLEIYRPF